MVVLLYPSLVVVKLGCKWVCITFNIASMKRGFESIQSGWFSTNDWKKWHYAYTDLSLPTCRHAHYNTLVSHLMSKFSSVSQQGRTSQNICVIWKIMCFGYFWNILTIFEVSSGNDVYDDLELFTHECSQHPKAAWQYWWSLAGKIALFLIFVLSQA